jgi:putative DNA primase/helicase
VFIATNPKPTIKGTDEAIWSRIRLVPFPVTFAPEQQDKKLKEKLRKELPGILRWAVQGCIAWQREGLGVPDEVAAATQTYREEMDPLAGFIEEMCIVGPSQKARGGHLFKAYNRWREHNEGEVMSLNAFGALLGDRGFPMKKTNGVKWRLGIGLKSNVEVAQEDAA